MYLRRNHGQLLLQRDLPVLGHVPVGGKLPSELAQPRTWRTRENPFSPEDWHEPPLHERVRNGDAPDHEDRRAIQAMPDGS